MIGTVKFWTTRGWGMITAPGHESVFCHINDCHTQDGEQLEIMREGDKVLLDVKTNSRGPRAWNVVLQEQGEKNGN